MPAVDRPLTPFLSARSVAIVGASVDPDRIGGRPLRYLLASGYHGRIFPVNPGRMEVQGVPAFGSLRDLPEVPDLAIVAVGRDQAAGVVAACAAVGVRAATVFAAGFAETDAAGRAAQAELCTIAADGGVRLLGPNSNGTIAPVVGGTFAFTPLLAEGLPPIGPVAIATQSAAVGTYWLRRLRERRIGMRAWVHTGNEGDLGLGDVLVEYLADPAVRVILCGLEQWRRPTDLEPVLAVLRGSATELVVLPLGRSDVGRQAAVSHTGALVARRANVVTGLLRQAGAHVVNGLEEAVELAAALEAGLPRRLERMGVLTTSGGLGVLLADALSMAGFDLPELDPALQARLRAEVPFCSPRNPVDMTAQGVNQPALFATFVRELVSSGSLDGLAVFVPHAHADDPLTLALLDAVPEARARGVALVAVGTIPVETAADLRGRGVAVFDEPLAAAAALRALADRASPEGGPPVTVRAAARPPERPAGAAVTSDEVSVKRHLADLGFDVVRDEVATDAVAAGAAADLIGYPVVVKLFDPGVAHKARAGGVVVGLRNRAGVEAAAGVILSAASARVPAGEGIARPPARLLVEPLVLGDELFVGAARDPDWGVLGLLGRGGVSVEDGVDIAFRRLPIDRRDLESMLDEVPALRTLFGLGGRAAALDTLVRLFAALGAIAGAPGVGAVELNPVILRPDGAAVIVDALIAWAGEGPG